MKKIPKILALSILGVFLLAGTAMAYSVTYNDDYANWPGHYINSADVIGTPSVGDMTVTTTSGYLDSVSLQVWNRRVWDSLFINTDSACVVNNAYEGWDFYYIDNPSDSDSRADGPAPTTGFYTVGTQYEYLYSTSGRVGHPSGIKDGTYLANADNFFKSMEYTSNILTYTFVSSSIYIGDEGTYTIGYSPWCANDVFLTPVPEPLTILLLGFGLLGLGLARRKS